MRVSLAMRYDSMVRQIGGKQEDLARLSDQLAGGRRLERPSEAPAAWSQASSLNESVRQLNAYRENIEFATGWNNQSDLALNQLNDLLTRARDVGLHAVGVTAALNASELGVPEVNQLIDEVVQVANQEHNGRHLFGGDSGSAPEPFTVDRDAEGNVTTVHDFASYDAATAWQITARVGKNSTQTVNLDGRSVFLADRDSSGDSILQHLVSLRDAMQAGDGDDIRTQLDALETDQKRVWSQNTVVGSRLNGLERRRDLLDSLAIDQQGRLSDLEDADMAETATGLQLKQTALEAAYQTATLLNSLNLQDYL